MDFPVNMLDLQTIILISIILVRVSYTNTTNTTLGQDILAVVEGLAVSNESGHDNLTSAEELTVSTESGQEYLAGDEGLKINNTLEQDNLTTVQGPERSTPFGQNNLTTAENLTLTTTTNTNFDINTSTQQKITTNNATSTNAPYFDETCSEFGNCDLPEERKLWYCYCGHMCEEYGDCCHGYGSKYTFLGSSRYECQQLSTDLRDELKGYFAISFCPDEYTNQTIKDKCSRGNIPEHGPSVVHNNSQIYKNKYCAFCHHVTDFRFFEIQFYSFKFHVGILNNLTGFAKINYTFYRSKHKLIPPEGTVFRFCVPKLITSDNPYCHNYINPGYIFKNNIDGNTYYRNFNCIPQEMKSAAKCIGEYSHLITTWRSIKGLSVMFSFRNSDHTNAENKQCEHWSKEIGSGICSNLETYLNYDLRHEYYLMYAGNKTEEEVQKICLLSVWSMDIKNLTQLTLVYTAINESFHVARVIVRIFVIKRSFLHEIRQIEKKWNERHSMKVSIQNNGVSTQCEIDILSKANFDQGETQIYFRSLKVTSRYDKLDVSNVTADKICRYMDFEVLRGQDTTDVVKSYNCRHDNIVRTRISVLSILTYTCSSLSVLALLVLIVHNRKRKLYLSIPGSNLENLSVSLMLSYVVFMTGIGLSSIRRLCYIIGVILHYLWLCVFSFMTISVVFIVLTLVQIQSRNTMTDNEITTRRRAFTILGLLLPILFVAPAVGVDQFGPSYLSSGYGKTVCFPNQYPANVIFFSGPVMLSVFTNSIFLVHIIIKVSKVRAEMRHIRKSVPFQDAKAYLRIAVLSGILWITGVLAAFLQSKWLEFIFIILCGLQGFFTAIANLTTFQARSGRKLEISSIESKKLKVQRFTSTTF